MPKVKPQVVPPKQSNLIDWLIECIQGLLQVDYLAPFQTIVLSLAYCYLVYYTALNLLSKNKYYINLSHNMIKWILLYMLSISYALFDGLFKFHFLSRITIMILSCLVVYPSRNLQKLHLGLAIRNKDKSYERLRSENGGTISFMQKILISVSQWLLSVVTLTVKLIHPENRPTSIDEKTVILFDVVKNKKYYLELSQSRQQIPEISSNFNIGMSTSYINREVPTKDSFKDSIKQIYKEDPKLSIASMKSSVPIQNFKHCSEVIQITKKKYEYFRDIQIRYDQETSQIAIKYSQNDSPEVSPLQQVRVMSDQVVEIVLSDKSKFVQFKDNVQLKAFLKPIVEDS